MMRLLWRDGRFSWPFVVFVIYVTLSLVIIDFVWRRFVMPFETLLIYAVLGDGAVAAILAFLWLRSRGASHRHESAAMRK